MCVWCLQMLIRVKGGFLGDVFLDMIRELIGLGLGILLLLIIQKSSLVRICI